MLANFLRPLFVLLALSAATPALACPFCDASGPTWRQSSEEADAAAIAKVLSVRQATAGRDLLPLATARCQVVQVLSGQAAKTIQVEMLDLPEVGSQWLVTGEGPTWSPVCELSGQRAAYLQGVRKLPAAGLARWQFLARYLEHADEALAEDAYGEFAIAPFAEVKAFAPQMPREQLWQWIESERTPESRRGLYYTMLGVCGTADDARKLQAMLQSPDKRPPGGFDALVACYLSLRGEAGLKLVEQQLLHAQAAESDVQAVLAALRFHGEEQHVLQRPRIALALRKVLDRPELAAVVIPDLARWQDWESMDALVQLFRESSGENAWLRVPIIAYLRACPLPEARRHLDRLAEIDPEAVQQADALALFGVRLRGAAAPTPVGGQSPKR